MVHLGKGNGAIRKQEAGRAGELFLRNTREQARIEDR
jgi:hypothetical protein